jgi:hypothetical protein
MDVRRWIFASTQAFANSKDVFAGTQRHWNRPIIVRRIQEIVRLTNPMVSAPTNARSV